MNITQCTNANQLRQRVRLAFTQSVDLTRALVIKTNNHAATVEAIQMFARELGARAILLTIAGKITEEQHQQLRRPGPRLVLLDGLETMAPQDLKEMPAALRQGGQALPIIVSASQSVDAPAAANDASTEVAV
ncbi:hypothetical protein [Sphingosinicella sp. BN140058]|uniref:hypothetical protein n=1 Tax=Sphingosinicella sp. BN140058 TaxID=1892855 RepID=UPI0010115C7A|nr:hypothetical protein [Sphingosinicella sp. BN140058]QAY80335.1 hypothetical protein ETR14_27210 [Sphingosinicella sp. BN140058]